MEEKFRCYIIADDYRWHFLTEEIDEYVHTMMSYMELMRTSKKENNYYIKNLFLTRNEINAFQNNKKDTKVGKVLRFKPRLRLVKDEETK